MSTAAPSPTPVKLPPFSYAVEAAAFQQRWQEEIPRRFHAQQTQIIPKQNILHFAHGRQWSFHNDQGIETPGEFSLQWIEHLMQGDERMNGDLAAFERHVDEMAKKFVASTMQKLRSTAEAATQATGNIVSWSRSKKNAGEVFLELLRRVQFGVDEKGEPSLPSFLDSPPEFLAELEEHSVQNPEFKTEIERVKATKIEEALQREAERKAKFKRPA